MSYHWGIHYSATKVANPPTTMVEYVENVHTLGFGFFQMFFGNSMSFTRKNPSKEDIKQALTLLQKYDMVFATHFPYTLNMCKDDCPMWSLQTELMRVSAMGGRVVVHVGTGVEQMSKTNRQVVNDLVVENESEDVLEWRKGWQKAADKIIENLNKLSIPDHIKYPLLLEPPAGEGKKIGWQSEQMKYIFDRVDKNIGFCLDTCHAFAAGTCRFNSAEAVEAYFMELDEAFGLERLKLIHLNDSEKPFRSMMDKHAPLTKGFIWRNPVNIRGLIHLWKLCKEMGVDMVSEVSSERDIEIMKELSLR